MRRTAFALALVFVVAACSDTATPRRTVPPTDPIATTTTVTETGRVLEVLGCDDVLADAEFLCQAYTRIHTQYIDAVTNADLAAAAARGLELLDGASSQEDIICIAPSREFVPVCDIAADEAEDSTEAAEAMLWGIAAFALDAHSAYLDPATLEMIEQEQEGAIEGIGAMVTAEDRTIDPAVLCGVISDTCRLYIVSTIPGSPAEGVGIKGGDVLVAVDGEDIEGWSLDTVTVAVRGEPGTEVGLTFERDGLTYDVLVIRAAVEVPVITAQTIGNVGYVRLSQFNETAEGQLREAIVDFLADGADTLVFDLRDNPGGLLTSAIDVTSQFLPDGDVVETRSPDETKTYSVNGNSIVPDEMRVVFIVNGASASASELVSAVLQERGRAIVIGENTFGKNTVQQTFNLANGGALRLTVGRWVTPGGLDFGGVGVTPDVAVEIDPALTAEALVDLALSVS